MQESFINRIFLLPTDDVRKGLESHVVLSACFFFLYVWYKTDWAEQFDMSLLTWKISYIQLRNISIEGLDGLFR